VTSSRTVRQVSHSILEQRLRFAIQCASCSAPLVGRRVDGLIDTTSQIKTQIRGVRLKQQALATKGEAPGQEMMCIKKMSH
jgi:hypothetical protein